MVQLPDSTTRIRAAPAMMHAGARDALVHRQHENFDDAPFETPMEQPPPPPSKPSLPPSPPSPPFPPHSPPPSADSFLQEDREYVYGDESGGGAAGGEPAERAHGASSISARARSRAYDLASTTPTAWWAAVGVVLTCAVSLCIALCLRSRVRGRRRRAQLEDVQSVFHTETWRKLA